MDEIMKADVFFFVTTIAVALLALGSTIALIFLVLILSKIKKLIDKLEMEADALFDDLEEFRDGVRSKTRLAGRFLEAFSVAGMVKRATDFMRSRQKNGDSTNDNSESHDRADEDTETASSAEENNGEDRYY